jgi:hypothetical protein
MWKAIALAGISKHYKKKNATENVPDYDNIKRG